MHFPDRVLRAPLRPIAISIRIEVYFKDRFQHQLCGGLHPPGVYSRNSQWTLAPTRLRDFHPPHGLWCIRLCSKVVPDAVQPFLQPRRFDSREALPIHSRRALIGLRQCVCMVQNVFPVDLVVEQVETVVRLFLRFLVQLPLKHPDLTRCLQAHRQSPVLSFFKSTSEVRVLPSAGVTRHHQYRDPPSGLTAIPMDSVEAATLVSPGSPPITQITFPACRAQYPGGPNRCSSVSSLFARPSPVYWRVGIHDFTFEACSGFTRVTGCKVAARPKADFCPEASTPPVARPDRSVATMSNRQLHRWILLPLMICAVGAHSKPNGTTRLERLRNFTWNGGAQAGPAKSPGAITMPERPCPGSMAHFRPKIALRG